MGRAKQRGGGANRALIALGAFALGCVSLVALDFERAAIAGDRVKLHWTAPADCPVESDVDAAIHVLLAGTTVAATDTVESTAKVTHAEDVYRVHLDITRNGVTSQRDVHGATCKTVADAAALILAMTIDPEAVSRLPSKAGPTSPTANPTSAPSFNPAPIPTLAPSSNPPPTPTLQASAPTPPPSAPPSAPPTPMLVAPPPTATLAPPAPAVDLTRRLRFSASALVDTGTLSNIAVGVEAGAGYLIGPLRLDLSFGFLPSRTAYSTTRPTAGGDIDVEYGTFGACLLIPTLRQAIGQRFELGLPCGGLDIGRMHATGFGVSNPGEGSIAWLAARAGGFGEVVVTPWLGLRLRLDAVIPVADPRFVLGNVGPVHEPAVAFRAGFGLDLRL
jgi:hypothetical protein